MANDAERRVLRLAGIWLALAVASLLLPRIEKPTRPAVLITSSAMPGPMARLFTRAMATLAKMAGLLGARPVGRLYVGLAAQTPEPVLPEAAARRAAALGRRLMSAAR